MIHMFTPACVVLFHCEASAHALPFQKAVWEPLPTRLCGPALFVSVCLIGPVGALAGCQARTASRTYTYPTVCRCTCVCSMMEHAGSKLTQSVCCWLAEMSTDLPGPVAMAGAVAGQVRMAGTMPGRGGKRRSAGWVTFLSVHKHSVCKNRLLLL